MKRLAWTRCARCGRFALPPAGVILERLYPDRTFCIGCGRLQLHCPCGPLPVR